MSEEQERQPADGVRDVLARTVKLAHEQIGQIHRALGVAIETGKVGDPDVVAGFGAIGAYSEASERFLRAHGVIFTDGDAKKGSIDVAIPASPMGTPGGTRKEIDGRPTTFCELLQLRIDQALPQKKQFVWKDLSKYAIRGGIKSVKEKGLLNKNKKKFSRQEAADIVRRLLTSPTAVLAKREGDYTKRQAISSFRLHKEQLERWCKEISYVWEKNDAVDFETAMHVRGLGYLEDILASQEN